MSFEPTHRIQIGKSKVKVRREGSSLFLKSELEKGISPKWEIGGDSLTCGGKPAPTAKLVELIPTRIYTFGLLTPDRETSKIVGDQIYLAHQYRNSLIEVEREYKVSRDRLDLTAPFASKIEVLTEELDQLKKKSRLARAKQLPITPEIKARVKEAKLEKKKARDQLREARQALLTSGAEDLKALDLSRKLASKARYKDFKGLAWGTKLLEAQALKSAAKGEDIHFRRWTGDGRVGIQLQGEIDDCDQHGLQVGSELLTDTRLRLTPLNDPKHPDNFELRFRVGSVNRDPIWVKFIAKIHRALPPDGVIKWAWIYRSHIGPTWFQTKSGQRVPNWKYELQLTVEAPSFKDRNPSILYGADRPTCGLDLGWRRLDDGVLLPEMRVANWSSSDGVSGEITLPKEVVRGLQRTDAGRIEDGLKPLKSIRSKNLDALRDQLLAWISTRPDLPEDWFKEERRYLPQWRSPKRFARLMVAWGNSRVPHDETILQLLTAFVREDQHLHVWEAEQREKSLRRRREHYRLKAMHLCQQFSEIHIENLNLTAFAKHASAEKAGKGQGKGGRKNRIGAAPSELVAALTMMAPKFNCRLVTVEPALTTKTCHLCGHVNSLPTSAWVITQQCEGCGESWDKDDNASHNIRNSSAVVKVLNA